MNYRKLKEELVKYKRIHAVEKEMRLHYEELFGTAIDELKFQNMNVKYLLSVMYELEIVTDDELVKEVIKNTIERHNLDKGIHTRKLFPNPKGLYS